MISRVSIVIPCFNYGRYVGEAVQSVLDQDMPVELVVVDDGSTDQETIEVLDRLKREKGIRVIRKRNEGLSRARNTGIAASAGEYIVCLDADDLILPGYCSSAMRVLDAHPEAGFVYPITQVFGTENFLWSNVAFSRLALLSDNYVPCASFFRRRLWEEVGGFSWEMKHGYEDWDFWLSAVEKGWVGIHLPHPLFWYRKHGRTMLTDSHAKRKELKKDLRRRHPALYSFTGIGRLILDEPMNLGRFLWPLFAENLLQPLMMRIRKE